MSSLHVHLQQANHNKQLGSVISRFRLPYRDWIVTICFYSAVHLAEGLLFILAPLGKHHTETTKPSGFNGSIHMWRERLIRELVKQNKLSKNFLLIINNLRKQSNISRYLISPSGKGKYQSLNKLAVDYFSEKDIQGFFTQDLVDLEKEAMPYFSSISAPAHKEYTLWELIKNYFRK